MLYALYGGGGCISYCYITQPDFFHHDLTSWAIHEYGENKKNGLLTDANISTKHSGQYSFSKIKRQYTVL